MAILEAYGDKIIGGTADPTEITWTAWNALSTAEQEALGQVMITDVPGAIGTIQSNIIKLLWTNPNPTSELAPGAVTASENARNFDLLLVEWKRSTSAGLVSYTIVSAKGSGGRIHDTRVVNDEATITQRYRDVGTLSDGRISFGGGKIITPGSPGTTTTDRTVVIVTAVYGIKTTIDLNFSAIAQDVSISANKCMLSDGVTSVEDMLKDETIDLAPYASSSITIQGQVVARKIAPHAYLIAFNGITAAAASIDDTFFTNLPFTINTLSVGYLFANPSNSGEYDHSVRCMVVAEGNTITAAHPVMSNLYYGQLVVGTA